MSRHGVWTQYVVYAAPTYAHSQIDAVNSWNPVCWLSVRNFAHGCPTQAHDDFHAFGVQSQFTLEQLIVLEALVLATLVAGRFVGYHSIQLQPSFGAHHDLLFEEGNRGVVFGIDSAAFRTILALDSLVVFHACAVETRGLVLPKI